MQTPTHGQMHSYILSYIICLVWGHRTMSTDDSSIHFTVNALIYQFVKQL